MAIVITSIEYGDLKDWEVKDFLAQCSMDTIYHALMLSSTGFFIQFVIDISQLCTQPNKKYLNVNRRPKVDQQLIKVYYFQSVFQVFVIRLPMAACFEYLKYFRRQGQNFILLFPQHLIIIQVRLTIVYCDIVIS